MVRLREWEEKRLKALCYAAWTLFFNGDKRMWVNRDDLALLIRAGAILKYHGQVSVSGKGKKKNKTKKMWVAEVLYPDENGHTFFHEERKYFSVPKQVPRHRSPWGP